MSSPTVPVAPSPATPNRAARRHPEKIQPAYTGVAGAATYLDVDPKTIRRLIYSGELPAYRLRNKVVKIKLADLEQVLTRIPGGAA